MSTHLPSAYRLAVIVPCRNEALTITQVVTDFRGQLPTATIYVYDNCSTDDTATVAQKAGAIVRYEKQPGKGNVLRRMFADIEADIYILVDGDNTYEAPAVGRLIDRLINEQLDMVVGARRSEFKDKEAYRFGHRSGNQFLKGIVELQFGARLDDMLSGYRIFSRRFVKSFPAISNGFEIETELTIHTLELRLPFAEEPVLYQSRPSGSESKLNTIRDGFRVLGTSFLLLKETRPFFFFGVFSLLFSGAAIALMLPVLWTYLETGLVPRFPTVIIAASLMSLGFVFFTCGLILDSVARGRRELKRMAYLKIPRVEMDKVSY